MSISRVSEMKIGEVLTIGAGHAVVTGANAYYNPKTKIKVDKNDLIEVKDKRGNIETMRVQAISDGKYIILSEKNEKFSLISFLIKLFSQYRTW